MYSVEHSEVEKILKRIYSQKGWEELLDECISDYDKSRNNEIEYKTTDHSRVEEILKEIYSQKGWEELLDECINDYNQRKLDEDDEYSDDEIEYKTIDYSGAEEILKKIYSPQEWTELQKQKGIDLEECINDFNKRELDEDDTITFREFFALRDFKETGYMRLYDETKESYEMQRALVVLTNDQHPICGGKTENFTIWRGETREISEVGIFKIGNEYSTGRFMSTTSNQNIIDGFMSYELEPHQINVTYKIEVNSLLVGADISAILHDGEKEVVILPNTKFEITDVKYDDNHTLCISMKNKPIIYDTWKSNFDPWLSEQSINLEPHILGSDVLQIDMIT